MNTRGKHLDGLSIQELCKPLSGRQMPRRALVGTYGDAEMSDSVAIKSQRQNAAMAARRIARRKASQ